MNWKLLWKSLKSKDMRNRILGVLGIVIIFRFLAHVPVPMADSATLKDIIDSLTQKSDLGGVLNMLSGGALTSFSIMLVGMSPYITASVITQLLTKAVPKLEELHQDGESGRRKINQWTRYITFPLAIMQSIAYIFILRSTMTQGAQLADMDMQQWIIAIVSMSAASMLLMFLGEIVTEKGIGNGMSLIIFAGIIAQMPQSFGTMGAALTQNVTDDTALTIFNWFTIPINATPAYLFLGYAVVNIIVLYLLVKINEAQRIVTINYAKRVQGNTNYGGVRSILPIKLITAGVIPVIFAVAFLALPAFLGQLFMTMEANQGLVDFGTNLVHWFSQPNMQTLLMANETGDWSAIIYPIVYFLLVVLFTYFYTSVVFNSDEIAENLQKQGGFIDGVRPGDQTAKYLRSVVNRLTLFGSLALGMIAIMPFVGEYVFAIVGLPIQGLAIGGTGLLIVVSVALETLRQLNSRSLMVTYDEFEV